jgi:hypothetical protein
MDDHTHIEGSAVKILSAWAVIGITSWADFAAFLGAIYTFVLLSEWAYKKVVRPICIARGWMKPLPTTQRIAEEIEELAQP